MSDEARKSLARLPFIGPLIAGNLVALGVYDEAALAKQDAAELFARMQKLSKNPLSPCVKGYLKNAIQCAREFTGS